VGEFALVSVTISSAILLITTILAASIFAGAAISQLYVFQNSFKEIGSRNQSLFDSSITIIAESSASNPNRILVWVKNVGKTSFDLQGDLDNASYWDVFLTFPNGTAGRITYSSTAFATYWTVQILNDMGQTGVWENGETILITIYTPTVQSGSYQIILTLTNGASCQDKFSL
jgi:hypothetical protein